MNGSRGSRSSTAWSGGSSGSSSWKFGITTAGAPGTRRYWSIIPATNRLIAWSVVVRRRSSGPAANTPDTAAAPFAAPYRCEAQARHLAGAGPEHSAPSRTSVPTAQMLP